MKNTEVTAMGIKCPIIREGDNLVEIVSDAVIETVRKRKVVGRDKYDFGVGKPVIGITESVVARAAGMYVYVDEIAEDLKKKFPKDETVVVLNPIYSRNRFSMILKGIARAFKKVIIYMPDYDEVGNPSGVNPFTGVDIAQYYQSIVEGEKAECVIHKTNMKPKDAEAVYMHLYPTIYCGLHDYNNTGTRLLTLADICRDKNPNYGLLGTNKANEERLKLFPSRFEAKKVCELVKKTIKNETGRDVIVMVYGDGCYKDIDAGIWECADPVTSPGYTDEQLLNSTPNEVKIKALADDKFANLNGTELEEAIKHEVTEKKKSNLKGRMDSQGTTPRRYVNLLASLMDLVSGSGDRATPVVLVCNYFKDK